MKLYTLDNQFIKETDFIYDNLTGILEYPNGTKKWFVNDKRHRIGGPAIECSSGAKEWWIDGKLHRIDGPAIEYSSGIKLWYINGKKVTELECKLLYDIMKLKEIKY